ncbi:MAG: hypothetical protein WBG01_13755 [Bacteroidota bacterium]
MKDLAGAWQRHQRVGLRHTRRPTRPGHQSYFAALELLRGHLFRCLTQIALVADTEIQKIPRNMRYEDA